MRSALAFSLALALAACSAQAPREPKDEAVPADLVDHDIDRETQDPRCAATAESVVDTSWMRKEGILPPGSPDFRGDRPWARQGLVSNAALAKRLAMPILDSQFPGYRRGPLHAQLKAGVWSIDPIPPRKPAAGGTFHIEICQSDARILNLYAGQ